MTEGNASDLANCANCGALIEYLAGGDDGWWRHALGRSVYCSPYDPDDETMATPVTEDEDP